jgi:hypothetical protein
MMPVYPLDGGQILRSLLWFVLGRARSLFVASIVGFIGLAALVLLTIWVVVAKRDMTSGGWFALIAFFIATRSWSGLREAWALSKIARIPRREGFACPSCHTAPPLGAVWRCAKCGNMFDTFASNAFCPHCGVEYNLTQCIDCGVRSPMSEWRDAGLQK